MKIMVFHGLTMDSPWTHHGLTPTKTHKKGYFTNCEIAFLSFYYL